MSPETRPVRVLVAADDNNMHEKYEEALEKRIREGCALTYGVERLERHDWLDRVAPYDLIFWHPRYMGPRIASHFKEKVYFMEHHLGKRVVPNFNSIWHFESKIAQSYIFRTCGIPTPETTVSFDAHEAYALLEKARFPLVFKAPFGSGSRNVWLARTKEEAQRHLAHLFADRFWDEAEQQYGEGYRAALRSWTKRWFWRYLLRKAQGDTEPGAVYWQEFIEGNDADLRIVAVGDSVVSGFWRHNRPDDFRASGSGLVDYEKPLPEEQMRYCLRINKELELDSMAYDILFTKTGFVIAEMSYGFVEKYVERAPGHFRLSESGALEFVAGHLWPQEHLVAWGLRTVTVNGARIPLVAQASKDRTDGPGTHASQ